MLRGLASHNEIRVLSKLLIGMMKIHGPQLPAQLRTELLSQLPASLFAFVSPELQPGLPAELPAPVQPVV